VFTLSTFERWTWNREYVLKGGYIRNIYHSPKPPHPHLALRPNPLPQGESRNGERDSGGEKKRKENER